MQIFIRILKPLLLGTVMLISLRMLGLSYTSAAFCCLVPIVLGSLDILCSFAYTLTAVVFIAAIVSTLPSDEHIRMVKDLTHSIIANIQGRIDEKNQGKTQATNNIAANDSSAGSIKLSDMKVSRVSEGGIITHTVTP